MNDEAKKRLAEQVRDVSGFYEWRFAKSDEEVLGWAMRDYHELILLEHYPFELGNGELLHTNSDSSKVTAFLPRAFLPQIRRRPYKEFVEEKRDLWESPRSQDCGISCRAPSITR